MRYRADPFFLRPLGFCGETADGLFAQAIAIRYGITEREVAQRVHDRMRRAAVNPRGLGAAVRGMEEITKSKFEAVPIRVGHVAPLTDGAASMVLASASFLRANPQCRPIARITGIAWSNDSYQLGAERLAGLGAARRAWNSALSMANRSSANDFDVIELDSPTAWHEAAWVRAFGIEKDQTISPSGGTFAQNPFFCAGLINAVEAVLQVCGQAGPVQVPGARCAVAHGCHGFAQQGNVVALIEQADSLR
jgi:acetyl-CoA acetyltransferase